MTPVNTHCIVDTVAAVLQATLLTTNSSVYLLGVQGAPSNSLIAHLLTANNSVPTGVFKVPPATL
ncbi:hypothetical protein J6590_080791 [Homalodisca vitripennis]|nr:hypothetical protein J6590_080791 [Homalodisca vitripennis]